MIQHGCSPKGRRARPAATGAGVTVSQLVGGPLMKRRCRSLGMRPPNPGVAGLWGLPLLGMLTLRVADGLRPGAEEADQGREVFSLGDLTGWVRGVCFSPDGTRL